MANSEAWKRLNDIASSWVKECSPLVVGSGGRNMESVDLGLGSGGLGEVTPKRSPLWWVVEVEIWKL